MREAPLSRALSHDSPAFALDHGPYRRVRHPFHMAYHVSSLAVVLITGHPLTGAVCMMMMSSYAAAAVQEEGKFPSSTLAPAYRACRQPLCMFPSPHLTPTT